MLAVEDADIPLIFSDFREMIHSEEKPGLTCKLQSRTGRGAVVKRPCARRGRISIRAAREFEPTSHHFGDEDLSLGIPAKTRCGAPQPLDL